MWLEPLAERLTPYLASVAADTLADAIGPGPGPTGIAATTVELESGAVRLALRRRAG